MAWTTRSAVCPSGAPAVADADLERMVHDGCRAAQEEPPAVTERHLRPSRPPPHVTEVGWDASVVCFLHEQGVSALSDADGHGGVERELVEVLQEWLLGEFAERQ